MLDAIALHPLTKAKLTAILARPPHAVLLSAPAGSGKRHTALQLTAALLQLPTTENTKEYPYLRIIEPDEQGISIDQIRSLQAFLRLQVPGTADIRRIIIVIDAGRMRTEAQNAFLKTLEEPPADTLLLLTAENAEQLLPTIRSRTQVIDILPLSGSQAAAFFSDRGHSSATIARAHAMSRGQAGLLHALLADETHPFINSITSAKELLATPVAERLLQIDSLSKDQVGCRSLLDALSRIAEAALLQACRQHKADAIERWRHSLERTEHSRALLERRSNLKLLLSDLFMAL